MKNLNLVLCTISLLLCFSCATTKEPIYTGDFWKEHNKSWPIQKWHLNQWNELRPSINSWEEQKYSIDSSSLFTQFIQSSTLLDDLKLKEEMVKEKIVETEPPTLLVIEKISVVEDITEPTKDTLTVFISIYENHDANSLKTYNVIVGCYKTNPRAKHHLSELKAEGHKEAKILISKYGLNRVSIKAFLEKALAQKFANKYRPIRNDVWVYTLKNSK